jgi:hypothetical protein
MKHGWNLVFTPDFDAARAALRATQSIGVVISGTQIGEGASWKDLLQDIQAVPLPPQLVVADRLADEHLWGEVLNLGGYDVLITPFVEAELLHVVSMAWQFRKRELAAGSTYEEDS